MAPFGVSDGGTEREQNECSQSARRGEHEITPVGLVILATTLYGADAAAISYWQIGNPPHIWTYRHQTLGQKRALEPAT